MRCCLFKFQSDDTNVSKVKKLLSKRKLCDDFATSMNEHSGIWLTFNSITLTTEAKDIITFGNWLTDKHMNFAQSLLKKQNNRTLLYIAAAHCYSSHCSWSSTNYALPRE